MDYCSTKWARLQSVRLAAMAVPLSLALSVLWVPVLPAAASAKVTGREAHQARQSGDKANRGKNGQGKPAIHPEPILDNLMSVTPDQLVSKPAEFLNKNLKFTAKFFAFSSLALDYKPAFRSSKTHLSFLVLTPGSHVPLSELKLAMMIPKEKDPESNLLATLKDGDDLEIVGREFSTALDDPWVEVFKLKKLNAGADEKKAAAGAETKGSGGKPGEKVGDKQPERKAKPSSDTKKGN